MDKKEKKKKEEEEEHEELLTLQLSTGNHHTTPARPPLLISTPSPTLTLFASPAMNHHMTQPHQISVDPLAAYVSSAASNHEPSPAAGPSRPLSSSSRARRSSTRILKDGKTEDIPAPYPWATTKRAQVHSRQYLISNGIGEIIGAVQCKKCDQKYEIEYDLIQKFEEVASYVSQNKSAMRDRAPAVWMNPTLPDCKFCGQTNCVKPEMDKKRSINWLFLLLGQMLGVCKLSELKYFCKHTKNHRTGAKDRVLYLTYLGLLKQLDPNGPFDI